MKKMVLVMVCALIMIIFIAFNYLLWDRENKIQNIENLNVSKNTSIDALGEKIKSLDDENKKNESRISSMQDENTRLQNKNVQLEQDLKKNTVIVRHKNDIIVKLKQQADTKPFEAIIRKWAEDIDKGQYEAAYHLQLNQFPDADYISPDDFAKIYKENIKSIKVKALKLEIDKIPEIKKSDIIFRVTLDIKKREGSGGNLSFNDGINERFFTIDYDSEKGDWVISNISPNI